MIRQSLLGDVKCRHYTCSMNCKNLQHFSPSRVKAPVGLPPRALAELMSKVRPELEQRRTERLAARPDRKRRMGPTTVGPPHAQAG